MPVADCGGRLLWRVGLVGVMLLASPVVLIPASATAAAAMVERAAERAAETAAGGLPVAGQSGYLGLNLVPERQIRQGEVALPAWKEQWDRVRALVRERQTRAAADGYEKLLADYSWLGAARLELARLWLELGAAERAVVHFELLREAEPDNPEYGRGLADALLTAGHRQRAAELFKQLLAVAPVEDEPRLLAGLAAALQAGGQAGAAVPYYQQLLTREPNNAEAAEQLALIYQQLGRFAEARPLVRQLAAPAAAPARLLGLAAEVHEALGLNRQAAGYWRRLLVLDADHPLAATRLEAYLLREGQGEEALKPLLVALGRDSADPRILRRLVEVHVGLTRLTEALAYLQRYLALRPADREALLLALDLHNALGQRAEALLALERLLALDGKPAPEKLEQAALLYEAEARYEEALQLYQRILREQPEAVTVAARRLSLLARLGREDEIGAYLGGSEQRGRMAEILAAWHQLEPDDRRIMVALAFARLQAGNLPAAEELLAALGSDPEPEPAVLSLAAAVDEARDRPYAALQNYQHWLKRQPEQSEARRRALVLAAELGLAGQVAEHRQQLEPVGAQNFDLALEMTVARAEVYDLGSALAEFAELADKAANPAEKTALLLSQARIMATAGLPYEAEGLLRMALLVGPSRLEVYRELFALALTTGRYDQAEIWLEAFGRELDFGFGDPAGEDEPSLEAGGRQVEEMRLRLLDAGGDQRGALRLLRRLLAERTGHDDQFRLLAAKVLLAADSPWAAEALLGEMLRRPEAPAEALVLAALVQQNLGRNPVRDELLHLARQEAGVDPGRQLRLSRLLYDYRLYPQAAEVAAEAAAILPASTRAALLRAQALAAAGNTQEALAVLDQFAAPQPLLFNLEFQRLELLLQSGRLEEAVALATELMAAQPWSSAPVGLKRVHALWLQRQWRPALAQLAELLTPSAAGELAARAAAAGVVLPPDEPPGLWARLTGAAAPLSELVEQVMSPAYAAGILPGDQRLREAAASLYADYRHQQRVALELKARGAVERREFFAAAREFERLAQRYPDEGPILYDLAGLYSRQERWESEAAIYRGLTAARVEYPDLAEAQKRNRLKRRPRTRLGYDYSRALGWDGYQAMEQQQLSLGQWFAPYLGHELEITAARLHYRDPDRPGSLQARRFEVLYRRDAFAEVDIMLGLGGWLPASGEELGRSTLLGRAEIAGDLGDRFRGRLAYRRELVEDTLAAVGRGIRRESLSASAGLDILPRLEAGAGYNFHYFSDGNQTHGSEIWLTYTIITDPTLLTLSYNYDFRDSISGPRREAPLLADGFGADDHPYWAPTSYWRKTFELAFRHQLSNDPFLRDAPRYYTLRYATSYDAEGRPLQTMAGSLFLEWNPRLILEAGVALVSADHQRRRDFHTSLTYRW